MLLQEGDAVAGVGEVADGEEYGGEGHDQKDLGGHDKGLGGEFADVLDAGAFVDDADGKHEGEDQPEPVAAHVGKERGERIVERQKGEQGHLATTGDHASAMQELRAVLASREPLYARAPATVDTSNIPVQTMLDRLTATIEARFGQTVPAAG